MFKKTHGDDPNKLLFLDIDGVLNSAAFYKGPKYKMYKIKNPWHAKQYDLDKIKLLKEIHDKTKCTIVMSSSWRAFYFDSKSKSRIGSGCSELKRDFKRKKIVIRYKTSNIYDAEEWNRQSNVEWIKNPDGTFNTVFKDTKEPCSGITKFYERGLQIDTFLKNWKKRYPKVKFAVLDDDSGDLVLFGERFVHTSWYGESEEESGLTPKHVEKCIRLLND